MTDPNVSISAQDAKRTARNYGALVMARILSNGVQFIWQIVLASWLGVFEYGIYNTVMALFAIGTSVASFGIGMIAIREAANNPKQIGKYAAAMLYAQTILAGLGYVAIVLAAVFAPNYSNVIIAFTAIAGVALIIDTIGNIANDLLLAQERMVISSSIEIVHIMARVGLAAFALWLGWGLLGIYLVTIFTGVFRTGALWLVNWRDGLQLDWQMRRHIMLPMLVNAAPLAMSAFLGLLYNHADKLMTTSIIGEAGTGALGLAFLVNFGVIELLSTAVLVAMYPLLSRYHDNNATDTFGFIVEKLARFMLIAALPIAIGVTIFAGDVIRWLLPPDYVPAIAILRVLIWYTLLTMIGNVLSKALIIQNRQRLTLAIRAVTLTLNIMLNAILLIRYRTPLGAAVASVIAEAIAVYLMARIFGAAGFEWSRIIPRSLRVLLIGALAGAVMLIVGQIHFIVGGIVGVIAYGVGLAYGGALADDDWDLLYRLLAAMPGGGLVRRYWQRDVTINW